MEKKEIMKCEREKCLVCGDESDCDYFHQTSVHNMPIYWADREKVNAEMSYHLGWIWDQLKDIEIKQNWCEEHKTICEPAH